MLQRYKRRNEKETAKDEVDGRDIPGRSTAFFPLPLCSLLLFDSLLSLLFLFIFFFSLSLFAFSDSFLFAICHSVLVE